jgi:hypothetical protein
VLAALLRKIFTQNGIDHDRFAIYMEDYLNDPRNKIPQNIKARTSERGNLRKELLNTRITWKSFIKGLRFLKIDRAEISVKYSDKFGDQETVNMVINLDEEDIDKASVTAEANYPSHHRLGLHVIKTFSAEGVIMFKYIYDENWTDIDSEVGLINGAENRAWVVERPYGLVHRRDRTNGQSG